MVHNGKNVGFPQYQLGLLRLWLYGRKLINNIGNNRIIKRDIIISATKCLSILVCVYIYVHIHNTHPSGTFPAMTQNHHTEDKHKKTSIRIFNKASLGKHKLTYWLVFGPQPHEKVNTIWRHHPIC